MASVAQAVDIEQVGEDTFRSPVVPSRIERTFGGQTMAQALHAAQRTVEGKLAHSLHCYFVGPGDSSQPATLHVERVRDGRSFATRHVRVFQDERLIFRSHRQLSQGWRYWSGAPGSNAGSARAGDDYGVTVCHPHHFEGVGGLGRAPRSGGGT